MCRGAVIRPVLSMDWSLTGFTGVLKTSYFSGAAPNQQTAPGEFKLRFYRTGEQLTLIHNESARGNPYNTSGILLDAFSVTVDIFSRNQVMKQCKIMPSPGDANPNFNNYF